MVHLAPSRDFKTASNAPPRSAGPMSVVRTCPTRAMNPDGVSGDNDSMFHVK